jgi:hypothetical protein
MMKATINQTSKAWPTWREVFRSDTIPVVGPPFAGFDGQPRILVDVAALDADQRKRLAIKFARGWRLPSDRVLQKLVAKGTAPLSAEGVTVTEDAARLF